MDSFRRCTDNLQHEADMRFEQFYALIFLFFEWQNLPLKSIGERIMEPFETLLEKSVAHTVICVRDR